MEDEHGTLVELYWQGGAEVLGEKPVSVQLCPPGIETTSPRWQAGV
jgi:hypothetical protein